MQNNANFVNPYITNYIPQYITTNSSQDVLPSVDNISAANRAQEYINSQPIQPQISEMDSISINPFVNARRELERMHTGITAAWNDPTNVLLKPLGSAIERNFGATNYYENEGHLGKMALRPIISAHDFLLGNYDIKASDYADILSGKQTVQQVLTRGALNAYKNPIGTTLDVFSVTKPLSSVSKASKPVSSARKVEDALNLSSAEIGSQAAKVTDNLNNFKQSIPTAQVGAIKALETGIEVTDSATKKAVKDLSKAVDEYDKMIPEYAKIDNEAAALNQKLVRDGLANTTVEADKLRKVYEVTDSVEEFTGKMRKVNPTIDDVIVANTAKFANISKDEVKKLGLDFKIEYVDDLPAGTLGETKGNIIRISKNLDKATENATLMHELSHGLVRNMNYLAGAEIGNAPNFMARVKRAIRGADTEMPNAGLSQAEGEAIAYGFENLVANSNRKNMYTELITPELNSLLGEMADIPESVIKNVTRLDIDNIKNLANSGDNIAKSLLEGSDAYKKGYLKLVPHGLAEVVKNETAQGIINNMDDRLFAGKYSTRVFGNASYEDIAQQLRKSQDWLDFMVKDYTQGNILNEILTNKTIGGYPLITETTKKIKYIDPSNINVGRDNFNRILSQATDTPINSNAIPIDETLLKEISSQFNVHRGTQPFGGTLGKDLYKVGKGTMLAGGKYIAGNIATGTANAILNAQFNPITLAQDFTQALGTKGKLIKEMGIYRNPTRRAHNVSTPILKNVADINKPIGDFWNYLDSKIQNTFAEMATHNNLRNKGIEYRNRADALLEMDKLKLADTIKDVKHVALLFPTKSILPQRFHGLVSLSNPFWRWQDTALQSTMHMLGKRPILSNLAFNKFASNIAFDKEMQNRLNMGVSLDKPFVSYRYNPTTQDIEEVSAEITPQMTSFKAIGTMGKAIEDGDFDTLINTFGVESVPVFSAIHNAAKGKNRFGKPLVRSEMDRREAGRLMAINGSRRYKYTTGIGWEEINGGYADEVLSIAVNELLGYPKLFNSIYAPAAAGLYNTVTGGNMRYYKPYGNQIFGEFGEAGVIPKYANPRSSVSGSDLIDTARGIYSRRYYPQFEEKNQMIQPSMYRNLLRGNSRRILENSRILNQYLGGQE